MAYSRESVLFNDGVVLGQGLCRLTFINDRFFRLECGGRTTSDLFFWLHIWSHSSLSLLRVESVDSRRLLIDLALSERVAGLSGL